MTYSPRASASPSTSGVQSTCQDRASRAGASSSAADRRAILGPGRDQRDDRGQRGDIALGRSDALFRAGVERQRRIGQRGERRCRVIHHRRQIGAASLARFDRAQQIGAAAGLRDRQQQRVVELGRRMIDRRHRWCGRADRHADHGLDQIFGEGRRVIRRAAGAGRYRARRRNAQPGAKRVHGSAIGRALPHEHLGRLGRFGEHQCGLGRIAHASAFNSATKS